MLEVYQTGEKNGQIEISWHVKKETQYKFHCEILFSELEGFFNNCLINYVQREREEKGRGK